MRRARVKKRVIKPDLKYNSVLVAQLINNIMSAGHKSMATRIVYQSFQQLNHKLHKNELDVYKQALVNVMPNLELRTRRVGGSNYQVPMEVSQDRKIILSIRWIVTAARKRKSTADFTTKLATEIIDAATNTGAAIKKRDETHKMAEANRVFTHYRWS